MRRPASEWKEKIKGKGKAASLLSKGMDDEKKRHAWELQIGHICMIPSGTQPESFMPSDHERGKTQASAVVSPAKVGHKVTDQRLKLMFTVRGLSMTRNCSGALQTSLAVPMQAVSDRCQDGRLWREEEDLKDAEDAWHHFEYDVYGKR